MIKNALCRLISPLQISGNKRDSSADIRSCVRRLCAAASSKPYKMFIKIIYKEQIFLSHHPHLIHLHGALEIRDDVFHHLSF